MGKSNEFIGNYEMLLKHIMYLYNHNDFQIFYLFSSDLQGDYFRLGHGSDQHIRKPTTIQGLRGKKVVHVAVGALHCLAVTDNGECFAWGDNDHGKYWILHIIIIKLKEIKTIYFLKFRSTRNWNNGRQ